ncbi:DEAD/DEAH box helicase family protein [Leptothermofonsia sichuanensis E412]|uniref:DEAD/DEAH box helicase family protein n=1 Tax=Leptothermofonsia sichuanensis TaxID=2917832 RepID=UPI001CA72314|nr:DEAD/DEAH box helicase family protein [Leptothermofonsia sichuanensis]QZZ21273.1 DEAD/DEAH box helicase family protein [Leptothermofonsia sichuanensis E412]
MTASTLNPTVLEPLFAPWQEPNAHRVRAEKSGDPAVVKQGRRASPIEVVNNLRAAVREWREAFYIGASDTTIQLLNHWFNRAHRQTTPDGEEFEFRYYFCQREAVETLIYLKEVRRIECLSQIIAEFGGANAELQALGITDDEDAWSRYAFKLVTGAGKTKVMSLCIVWSYFHALRESDSEMARHFVVIAPNLTVYERLKDDFGNRLFDEDPLIPPEWRGDWNLSVVLQDEASGAATGGTLYLTNIHRLYDPTKRKSKGESDTYDWMGPAVSKTKALDTGAALRDRITAHRRVMVLNDEAHHVWDPGSAWNEAIRTLHETILSRSGGKLVAQLDFSATPKDNKGLLFKHIVCDTPLGEAVDAGIVKTPLIGQASRKLVEQADDNAAYRWEQHLLLGYERWKASQAEWEASGKKPLLFIMCDDTDAADQITQRFNTDPLFEHLNGKTINLHTNLKGKLKKVGRGKDARYEFVEDEKAISDDDLKALRKLSRELDSNASPYFCIVSVLMLREGWDVRNVTTIVPLRPYSSKANILPEQTLGRGLRRMTPPGQANELVTVVEHPAFASLYQQELAQEGLPLEIVELDRVPATTISIFPDEAHKDLNALNIQIPTLSAGFRIVPKLEGLTIQDVKKAFKRFQPLPLPSSPQPPSPRTGEGGEDYGLGSGSAPLSQLGRGVGGEGNNVIEYEGRHLFTGEVVEKMQLSLPLLESGIGAVSYYVKQLETICKLRGLHPILAPLIQTFLEEILFEQKTTLFDPALVARLADSDVGEHLRAVFVPLIRSRTTTSEERLIAEPPKSLNAWKPYQVTLSERRPALEAAKTLFNLVTCNRELEVAVAKFCDRAPDVAAFAKNAGSQCLRIDYLANGDRLAFYTPDFFIRTLDGHYYLVETKGREDRDVPLKAKAAIAWCEAASRPHPLTPSPRTREGGQEDTPAPLSQLGRGAGGEGVQWHYLYIPQGVFERMAGDTVAELARACAPALQNLLQSEEFQDLPLFVNLGQSDDEVATVDSLIDPAILNALPSRYRRAADQAVMLYRFFENKEGMNYAPVFTALLGSIDEVAKGFLVRRLQPEMPVTVEDQKAWFAPYLGGVDRKSEDYYRKLAQNLKRTLVFNNGLSLIGLLRSCLDYALNDTTKIGGVFEALQTQLRFQGGRKFLETVTRINDFRNTYIAHQEQELTDKNLAEQELKIWIEALHMIGK